MKKSEPQRSKEAPCITQVNRKSLGREIGLEPGDKILRINKKKIKDLIEYYLEEATERLLLEVEKKNGEVWEIDLEKDEDQGLGVTFSSAVFDRIKRCRNRCVFCFVDQMPFGLRPSLYIKDDDYRLSFLQGSYVTLSNLEEEDWRRIQKDRLSPLYVSVHATTPKVREVLFGDTGLRDIMVPLKRLASWGINLHTQAVIVPGINDGEVLSKTIADLGGLWPSVQSIAIVPVGLTKHRSHLPELRRFTTCEARDVLNLVDKAQQKFLEKFGTRLVFAADEFYIQAGREFPPLVEYEDLWQLENGVGLWALFREEFFSALSLLSKEKSGRTGDFVLITGTDAAGLWPELIEAFLAKNPGINIEVRAIPNHFFGEVVTVTGLIAGKDIIENLENQGIKAGQTILIPRVMLRQGDMIFLDGISLDELRASLVSSKVGANTNANAGVFSLKIVETNGETLVRTFLGLEE